jgi:hypothetical protein
MVVGYTLSYGAGANDILVTKFTASGDHVWSRSIGSENADLGYDILETTDGGFLLTGMAFVAGKAQDAFALKVDSSFVFEWGRTLGETSTDIGHSVVQTQDGGFGVVGWTQILGGVGYDVQVSMLDPAGALLWTRILGGPSYDQGQSCDMGEDGSLWITGWLHSYEYDALLSKHDPEGYTCECVPIDPETSDWIPVIQDISPVVTEVSPMFQSPSPIVSERVPVVTTVCLERCGDVDGSGILTPADGYTVLNFLGSGPAPISCWAANVDEDDALTPADGYTILNHLGAGPALDCADCEL